MGKLLETYAGICVRALKKILRKSFDDFIKRSRGTFLKNSMEGLRQESSEEFQNNFRDNLWKMDVNTSSGISEGISYGIFKDIHETIF